MFYRTAVFSVIAAEQAIFEGKIVAHQQVGVSVVFNVLRVDFVVFNQVPQHARQEGNVGTGTNRRIDIGDRSRTRKARVNDDKQSIVVVFASIAQRNPTGWASAALPPITTTTLAF